MRASWYTMDAMDTVDAISEQSRACAGCLHCLSNRRARAERQHIRSCRTMVGGPKGSTSGAAGPWWGAERQQLLSCRTMVGGRKAAHPELQDHGGGASRRTEDGELVGQVADDGVLRKQEAQRHERERLQRVSQRPWAASDDGKQGGRQPRACCTHVQCWHAATPCKRAHQQLCTQPSGCQCRLSVLASWIIVPGYVNRGMAGSPNHWAHISKSANTCSALV